jgi:isopentenyldiphosphate isomerase
VSSPSLSFTFEPLRRRRRRRPPHSVLLFIVHELTILLAPSLRYRWPSYLDNTVAGGISAGSTPYSTILRESIEEASLPPAFVASRIHGSSVLVYNYRTADGWLQPEVQYVYDLRMDAGEGAVRPGVNDGEVDEFMLMELDEVVERMVKGEFKPNCAIVSHSPLLRGVDFADFAPSRSLTLSSG